MASFKNADRRLRAARHRTASCPNSTLSWKSPGRQKQGQAKSRTLAYIARNVKISTPASYPIYIDVREIVAAGTRAVRYQGADRPREFPKYRKKLESGLSTSDVLL